MILDAFLAVIHHLCVFGLFVILAAEMTLVRPGISAETVMRVVRRAYRWTLWHSRRPNTRGRWAACFLRCERRRVLHAQPGVLDQARIVFGDCFAVDSANIELHSLAKGATQQPQRLT